MRRGPVFAVGCAPGALEPLAIPGARPEFRFFQVDGLRSGLDRCQHALGEIITEGWAGAHMIDIPAVRNDVAPPVGLRLVDVPFAVKLAVQVILVVPPGHARHDVDDVALIFP